MKVILTIDTEDNTDFDSLEEWFEYHNEKWINRDRPTHEELALAFRNECYSWLDDLGIIHEVEVINEHSLEGVTSNHFITNRRGGQCNDRLDNESRN